MYQVIESIRSPVRVNCLMHYYAKCGPWDYHPPDAPIVEMTHDELSALGAITKNGQGDYQITDMGKAWVEAILLIEPPQQRWVCPATKERIV